MKKLIIIFWVVIIPTGVFAGSDNKIQDVRNEMSEEKQLTEIEKAIDWTAGTLLGQAYMPMMKENKEFNEKIYAPLHSLMRDPYFENTGQQSAKFDFLVYLERGLGGPKNDFEKRGLAILEKVLEDSKNISVKFSEDEEENAGAQETLNSIPGLLFMIVNIINGTTENFPTELRNFHANQPPY